MKLLSFFLFLTTAAFTATAQTGTLRMTDWLNGDSGIVVEDGLGPEGYVMGIESGRPAWIPNDSLRNFGQFFNMVTSLQTNFDDAPVNLIIDYEAEDVDDIGSFAVAHRLADLGEVNILAMGAVGESSYVAPVANVINTFYGRPNIPIGAQKTTGGFVPPDYYGRWLVENFPNSLRSGQNAPDVVTMYRRILVNAPDTSVTFLTEAQMRNFANLWYSPADSISPLTGKELVLQKVKELVPLLGDYLTGAEHDCTSDVEACVVINDFPPEFPVTWVSSDYGIAVLVNSSQPVWSPVRAAYDKFFAEYIPIGGVRPAWGALTVLYAVRGLSYNGTTYSTASAYGRNVIDSVTGANTFTVNPAYRQRYLTRTMSTDTAIALIESLMDTLPNGVNASGTFIPTGQKFTAPIIVAPNGGGLGFTNYSSRNNEGYDIVRNDNNGDSAITGRTWVTGSNVYQILGASSIYNADYGNRPEAMLYNNWQVNGSHIWRIGGKTDSNTAMGLNPWGLTIVGNAKVTGYFDSTLHAKDSVNTEFNGVWISNTSVESAASSRITILADSAFSEIVQTNETYSGDFGSLDYSLQLVQREAAGSIVLKVGGYIDSAIRLLVNTGGVDVYGNADADTYSVGGAAGVSGTCTSVTVVNGIVTGCTP